MRHAGITLLRSRPRTAQSGFSTPEYGKPVDLPEAANIFSMGEPVCWIDMLCPRCGLLIEDEDASSCPHCGDRGADSLERSADPVAGDSSL